MHPQAPTHTFQTNSTPPSPYFLFLQLPGCDNTPLPPTAPPNLPISFASCPFPFFCPGSWLHRFSRANPPKNRRRRRRSTGRCASSATCCAWWRPSAIARRRAAGPCRRGWRRRPSRGGEHGHGSKPTSHGLGELSHFRTYFSGDWDVHWGYGLLRHGHTCPFGCGLLVFRGSSFGRFRTSKNDDGFPAGFPLKPQFRGQTSSTHFEPRQPCCIAFCGCLFF